MKTKNYLKIMIITTILCVSCSKSDDIASSSESNLEKSFIGVWKPIKFVVKCSSGGEEVLENTSCEQQGRLTVMANGTFSETYFYNYGTGCEEDDLESGTWKIINEKLFVTEEFSEEYEVTYFEVTENILQVGQYDTDYPCDSGGNSAYYYFEYTRI